MRDDRGRIAAMGRSLGPEVLAEVHAMFREEQERLAAEVPLAAADIAYGAHERHRIDLYRPETADEPAPVILWVHGGGFLRGDKRTPDHPYNAHAGRWAAKHGMIGAVMNYRLAPEHPWPAGGEDVGTAIAWLRANVAGHGGDPERIVAIGTSAGATHVATHIQLSGEHSGLAGAILISGLYGFAPLSERDLLYFGPGESVDDKLPHDAMTRTTLPLMLACSEFDPQSFQTETIGLLAARLAHHGAVPPAQVVAGHNHYSAACHLGTSDTRLSDTIRGFISGL